MTTYFVNLGKTGVDKVNRLFSAEPFSHDDNEDYLVRYNSAEKSTAFMHYGEDYIVMFHALMKDFPKEVKEDIRTRLSQLSHGKLEEVMNDLD